MMQAAEIAVFIGVAVIVSGLLLGFLTDFSFQDVYESFREIFDEEEIQTYTKVDKIGFIMEVYKTWEDCGLGEVDTKRVINIENTEVNKQVLSKEFIFTELKKINYCKTLQSKEFDCGNREDLIMEDIDLPALVTLKCENSKLFIKE